MKTILFFSLSIISGAWLGISLWTIDEKIAVVLLTTYLWIIVYGSTYYQVKWTMKLFKKYK